MDALMCPVQRQPGTAGEALTPKFGLSPTFGGLKKLGVGIQLYLSALVFLKGVPLCESTPAESVFMFSFSSSFRVNLQRVRLCPPFLWGAIALAAPCIAAPLAPVQQATQIRIDASTPYSVPGTAAYDESYGTAPSGSTLGLNSRYLTLNGQPWLPAMGEFHFSRYPRSQWEEEILKMKAAGVDIVATYVLWIHHEEIRGQFDWAGERDLRAFARLCARHHLYMVARIGPWDHAEARNGGLPDWVLKQGPTRVNDPAYLASVRIWYGQIARQLTGLLWKDGGPVIGIQLENEYSTRGPSAGAAHILMLKKLAVRSGLQVPLYFVTGWDNAVIPPRAVLPIYGGGYPDAPWDRSIRKLPPQDTYAFRFYSRVSPNARPTTRAGDPPDTVPYLTAEIGGGIEDTYHRRPVMHPGDIAAMFPIMLGSGINLYGTYMFQGGENPDGKITTLQESQQTGYPNDVPIKSYDFQAPLGEFGQERASFRKLKVFQYFLDDFGADLAPMIVHPPEVLPKDSRDLTTPRAAVRSRGDSGFIFFGNYVRNYAMPPRPATQFLVDLPGGTLAVPERPIDLPSGAYFIWPFNFRMGSVNLRYSTAQLFTRLTSRAQTTYYFEAIPGVPVEFAFNEANLRSICAPGAQQSRAGGVIYENAIDPGLQSSIDLTAADGKAIRIVVLTAEQVEDAWKVRIDGSDHLLMTAQELFADPDSSRPRIWLRSNGSSHFAFTIMPPVAKPLQANLPLTQTATSDAETSFAAEAPERHIELTCRQTKTASQAPPVHLGPEFNSVAQAPPAGELPSAARWSITIPPGSLAGLSNLFLKVQYQGDVARFYSGSRLLTDDFYNGRPWSIGLRRFLDASGGGSFDLSILPLRRDAPVYFELPAPLDFPPQGQIDALDKITLIPQYQLVLSAEDQ